MNIWNKGALFVLCPCISVYSLPLFASFDEATPASIELNEPMMEGITGSGNVDIEMGDYRLGGKRAKAWVANRTAESYTYEMNAINKKGDIIDVLLTGTLDAGQAEVISGKPSALGIDNRRIQVRLYNAAGLEASKTSWAGDSLDNDSDGITGALELLYGLDPNDPSDALQDPDADSITNIDEINVYGTDPHLADSDGDGLDDNIELFVLTGYDPLDASDGLLDADMDYFTNADEYHNGTDANVYDAGAPDTDGDGVPDTLELRLGINPADPTDSDVGGNTAEDKAQMHALNRLSYGPTPALVNEIEIMGATAWIANQFTGLLDFSNLRDDPAQVMREDNPRHNHEEELVGAIRPVHSIKHLQTRMGVFWDNHFNTFQGKVNYSPSELHEEDLFFVNALGNFRNLLDASAKSHAMMKYLDLISSKQPSPNENYAREVMELHTLGLTTSGGVYTPDDVNSLAKILSGWSSKSYGTQSLYSYRNSNSQLFFNQNIYEYVFYASNHVTGEKTFLGETYPAGETEQEEGERALDALAYHPATAQFICEKLAKTFVSDEPDSLTVSNCVVPFTANQAQPDQMVHAMNGLFSSAEFNDPANQRSKFKDDQEYFFALSRLIGVSAIGDSVDGINATAGYVRPGELGDVLQRVNQGLFDREPPTGYKEHADHWINTNSVVDRFREGNELFYADTSFYGDNMRHLVANLNNAGIIETGDVLRFLFKAMLAGDYDLELMEMGYWTLQPGGEPFVLTANASLAKLRDLVSRLAQLPEYNLH